MNDTNQFYNYKAKIIRVYDGDSIYASVDLGFGIIYNGDNGKGMALRLAGINAYELYPRYNKFENIELREEHSIKGFAARDRLRELISNKSVSITTIKDKSDSFGRYLAIVWLLDGTNINQLMVDEGHAVPYGSELI